MNKNLVKKTGRTPKACARCQKRKIKCNGGRPCLSCLGCQAKCQYTNQQFPSPDKFFLRRNPPLGVNGASLVRQSRSAVPLHLQKLLSDVAMFLDGINLQLFLNLDSSQISAYEGKTSIETVLIGKQMQYLNRFSDTLSATAKHTPTTYFGLYSSLLHFTPMGISWLIQKLISYSDERAIKETVYLILKFLDTSTSNYESDQRLRLTHPLKFYACSKSLVYDEERIIMHILNELKRSFEEIGSVPNSFHAFREAENGFSFSALLLKQHQSTFNHSKHNQQSLKRFLEESDSIFCLCLEFFQKSIFSQLYDIGLLSSLLSLIEIVYWREDSYIIGQLISSISRRSLDSGLNRWEYYVMKDESTADEYRRLWWNTYWWDKWHASMTGKPPSIPEEMCWCLFPRNLMQLGIDESMDCLSLIDNVDLNLSDHNSSTLFCHILMSKLITRLFSVVLYNRNFTDYRLFTAEAANNLAWTVEQLNEEFDYVSGLYTAFERKIGSFLRSNSQNEVYFEVLIQYEFIGAVSFQSMQSLLLRIQNLSQKNQKANCFKQISVCEERVSHYSTDLLLSVIKNGDHFQIIKSMRAVFTTVINSASLLIKNPRNNPFYHLSLICGVVSKLSKSLSCTDDGSCTWKRLQQGVRFSLILARACSQAIMSSQNISLSDVKAELLNYGHSCVEILDWAFDINSAWYKNLMCNYRQSCFSESVLQNIDKRVEDFAHSEKTDATSIPLAIGVDNGDKSSSSEWSPKEIDLQNLDFFLKSDATLDFLTSLWHDAPPHVFDFGNQDFSSPG